MGIKGVVYSNLEGGIKAFWRQAYSAGVRHVLNNLETLDRPHLFTVGPIHFPLNLIIKLM